MAAIPIPSVNTPTYQSWGASVAGQLNGSFAKVGGVSHPGEGFAIQYLTTHQENTNANGVFIVNYGPFKYPPFVITTITDVNWAHTAAPFDIQVNYCQVIARTVAGAPIASAFVNIEIAAIGVVSGPLADDEADRAELLPGDDAEAEHRDES